MTAVATEAAEVAVRHDNRRRKSLVRGVQQVGVILFGLVLLVAMWEGYKAFGSWTGGMWPGTERELPVPSDNLNMPHSYDIVKQLFEPVTRRAEETLLEFLFKSAWFTFKMAFLGFVIGTIVGLALAVVMLRSSWLERGLVPWINVSQTIPLIALAPLVVTWGRGSFLSDTQSVAVIAAYLTFFPVAVNGLAGLKSPDSEALELMRSFAAPWSKTLFKLRFPAARPYLFPAFRLAAALSVVGTIVGEISAGVKGGVGRVVLDYAGKYSTGPERLYGSILAAAALGLFVFGIITLAEKILMRGQVGGSA